MLRPIPLHEEGFHPRQTPEPFAEAAVVRPLAKTPHHLAKMDKIDSRMHLFYTIGVCAQIIARPPSEPPRLWSARTIVSRLRARRHHRTFRPRIRDGPQKWQ